MTEDEMLTLLAEKDAEIERLDRQAVNDGYLINNTQSALNVTRAHLAARDADLADARARIEAVKKLARKFTANRALQEAILAALKDSGTLTGHPATTSLRDTSDTEPKGDAANEG